MKQSVQELRKTKNAARKSQSIQNFDFLRKKSCNYVPSSWTFCRTVLRIPWNYFLVRHVLIENVKRPKMFFNMPPEKS